MLRRESLIKSGLRSFFNTIFVMMGIALGLIPFLLIIGSVSSLGEEAKPSTETTIKILPNAEGSKKKVSSTAPVLLQINITGIIGDDDINRDTINTILIESRDQIKNHRVKAVLLNISSPGGTVVDADAIYRMILAYKEKYSTPVYAYVDGICASGGMYIAAAADKIFATPASLIGSVGVLIPPFFNVHETMKKIGVKSLTVSAGKGKDSMNPFRSWEPNESENFKAITNFYYQAFVDLIVKNRPIEKDRLINEYGAHVFPATDAKEKGFIDDVVNGRSDVIKALLKEANIEGSYQVVELESKKKWLKQLLKGNAGILSGKIKHEIVMHPYLDNRFAGQMLYLYSPFLNEINSK